MRKRSISGLAAATLAVLLLVLAAPASWAADCKGRAASDPNFGVDCDEVFDDGAGGVCVTTYIPHYFNWKWDNVPDAEKRYEVWKYGLCVEVAPEDADELPEWARPAGMEKGLKGIASGVLTDRQVQELKQAFAAGGGKSFQKLMKDRKWDCPRGTMALNDQCVSTRAAGVFMKGKGNHLQNIWNKQAYHVQKTTAPRACTPLWTYVWESYVDWQGKLRYRRVRVPDMGWVELCDRIVIHEHGGIQQEYDTFPCRQVSRGAISSYLPDLGPRVFDKFSPRVRRMSQTVSDITIGGGKVVMADSTAEQMCRDLKHKVYGNLNSARPGEMGQYRAMCLNVPTQGPQCSGYKCELPSTPERGMSTLNCRGGVGRKFYFGLSSGNGTPPPPGAVADVCNGDGIGAPKGVVYRDETTGWPKVFCPIVMEKVTFCDKNAATIENGGNGPSGGTGGTWPVPNDPVCSGDRPIKIDKICTCACPNGYDRDKNNPALCRNKLGRTIDPCDFSKNTTIELGRPYDGAFLNIRVGYSSYGGGDGNDGSGTETWHTFDGLMLSVNFTGKALSKLKSNLSGTCPVSLLTFHRDIGKCKPSPYITWTKYVHSNIPTECKNTIATMRNLQEAWYFRGSCVDKGRNSEENHLGDGGNTKLLEILKENNVYCYGYPGEHNKGNCVKCPPEITNAATPWLCENIRSIPLTYENLEYLGILSALEN